MTLALGGKLAAERLFRRRSARYRYAGPLRPYTRVFRSGPLRPTAGRTDQWLILRAAQSWACRDLRHAQYHQFRSRRAVYDGRVRCVFPAAPPQYRLLAGTDYCAGRGRNLRYDPRTDDAAMAGRP